MRFIEFVNVDKVFWARDKEVHALSDVSFEIEEGEMCVIVGEPGAGKSTVLNLLGGMDTVTEGRIIFSMVDISSFSQKQFTFYRRNNIGFVFQFEDLIPNLSVLENVEIASQLSRSSFKVEQMLKEVGLGKKLSDFPSGLSREEQQRVAIARALVKRPKLLLCDEPIGDLDYQAGKEILKLLQDINRRLGVSMIIATENTALAAMGDRVIQLNDGRVERVILNQIITPVEVIDW